MEGTFLSWLGCNFQTQLSVGLLFASVTTQNSDEDWGNMPPELVKEKTDGAGGSDQSYSR